MSEDLAYHEGISLMSGFSENMPEEKWPYNFLLNNGLPVKLPIFVSEDYEAHWAPEGFTNEQHHAHLDSTSSSSLKLVLDSPYAYLENMKRSQNGQAPKKNKSMEFGTISHLIILEPSEFRRRVIMAPEFNLKSNKGKDDWELFQLDQHPDAIIFRDVGTGRSEYDNLIGVVNAITSHEKIRDAFREGITERSGFFRCPFTGLLTRFRPDFMCTRIPGGHLIDFKTAKSTVYEIFRKQAEQLHYPIQKALYREGYKQINGAYPAVASWIAVENSFPFEPAIFPVDVEMITYGDAWYKYAIELLAECIKRKQFPQRQRIAETMVPSDYAMAKKIPRLEDFKWEH